MKLPPLRLLQLTESRLEVVRHWEPDDKTTIEMLGQQGLVLARTYGYPRHAALIGQLLAEVLD